MRRRILTLASLLLFVATVVLWGWSNLFADSIEYDSQNLSNHQISAYWLTTSRGELYLNRKITTFSSSEGMDYWISTENYRGYRRHQGLSFLHASTANVYHIPETFFQRFGFSFSEEKSVPEKISHRIGNHFGLFSIDQTGVSVPLWFIALLLAAPTVRQFSVIIRHRNRIGECLKCRYSLIGNTSGTCPECGTAIKSKDVPIKIG